MERLLAEGASFEQLVEIGQANNRQYDANDRHIINIVANVERGMPQAAHTCAARAGVIYLSKTVATEWAPYNVRVNCIGPGVIETELHRGVIDSMEGGAALEAELAAIAQQLAAADARLLGALKRALHTEAVGDFSAVLAREAQAHRALG